MPRIRSAKAFFILMVFLAALLSSMTALAAPTKVICVPWQGDITKYHTTWDGLSVYLKAVVHTNSTAAIYYKWVFGDGSESVVTALSGATKYNVEVRHTYTGAPGTPFTARLVVADNDALANALEDTYLVEIEEANLDSKINVAIDNGLWYLYKSGYDSSSYYRTLDGSPFMVWSYSSYFASPTASAIHAFQINGHKETGNPDQDPYVTAVERGFNWLFNGYYYSTSYLMLNAYNVGMVAGGNPDSNGNGKGIEVRDYGYRPVYQGGMVMDAIIASGTPDASSGRDFDGDGTADTYREVLQDMIDQYAWGQYDSVYSIYGIIGGWRYNWNDWPDNSACQWGAIGMIPAQEPPWNCTVLPWVKEYNNNWLRYSYSQPFSGHSEWGGFGYTSPSWGYALTPSGMVQLSFAGQTTADSRWVTTERWLADNWVTTYNWLGQNDVYAYYAFAKAMRLAKPTPVVNFTSNNFDWYRGNAGTMGLAQKIADRLVSSSYWDYYGPILGTSWGVIILRPVLFSAAPIACFDADPNPSYPDFPINFNPACSSHSEPGKDIDSLTLFEWDWDNDGVYDETTATPQEVTHAFACSSIPCVYPVKLRVTDDSSPARTATYVRDIQITNPPHPPVANVKAPMMVSLCSEDELTLDGSGSYDPDEGDHEDGCLTCPDDTITAYGWELDGAAPYDFNEADTPVVALGSDFTALFGSPGTYNVGLQVTDNTAAAYPGSGSEDLTDVDFGTLDVYNGCLCQVEAATGCGYVQLSWDDIGADQYVIYRSFEGPNTGFENTSSTTETEKIMGSLVMGVNTWFRVKAISGTQECLSQAVMVYADPVQCNPTADAGGPYVVCAGDPVTLSGVASTAQVGTIVTWEWDLDNDGEYDDAFGETVTNTWNTPGTYTVGLEVTSSDSLVLQDTVEVTVTVEDCGGGGQGCVADLAARAKDGKIQLVWSYNGADHYNVYRSTVSGGPYQFRATTTSTYSTYLDGGVVNGVTYYYVVRQADPTGTEICESNEASAVASTRVR